MTSTPTDSPHPADIRARFAASCDAASKHEAPPEMDLGGSPLPGRITVWRIKGTIGCTMLPALLPRCPLCSATAWLSTDADAEHSPVGWALNEITVGVLHSPEREALFKDRSKWFDPRAVKQRG